MGIELKSRILNNIHSFPIGGTLTDRKVTLCKTGFIIYLLEKLGFDKEDLISIFNEALGIDDEIIPDIEQAAIVLNINLKDIEDNIDKIIDEKLLKSEIYKTLKEMDLEHGKIK